jgi:hypothetical protein
MATVFQGIAAPLESHKVGVRNELHDDYIRCFVGFVRASFLHPE